MKFYLKDITKINADAIVNASDKKLSGGGGIDKAIHNAAGSEKLKKVLVGKTIDTGEAIITEGFDLPSRYIIHTAGPRYKDGTKNEAQLLKKAYEACMDLAKKHSLKSIVFCSLSTGTFRYPLEEAATIAVSTIIDWMNQNKIDVDVSFAFLDIKTKKAYENAYLKLNTCNQKTEQTPEAFKTSFKVGDIINHKKFGSGIICSILEKTNDALLEIEFSDDKKTVSEITCHKMCLISKDVH